MSYTDTELQNLSRSKDKLVRTLAARYYVERDARRTNLARVEAGQKSFKEAWLTAENTIRGVEKRMQAGLDLILRYLTQCSSSPNGCEEFCEFFGCGSLREIRDAFKEDKK